MSQVDVAVCPLTNKKIVVYKKSSDEGHYGIARQEDKAIGREWSYYHEKNNEGKSCWLGNHDNSSNYTLQIDAIQKVHEYVANIKSLQAVMEGRFMHVVNATQIDKVRVRFAYKCPKCGSTHKSAVACDGWDEVNQHVTRACPKSDPNIKDIQITLWVGIRSGLVVPHSDMPKLPHYACKECFASGEYIGLREAEPCSTCFPGEKKS